MAHPHVPLVHHRPLPRRPGVSFALVNGSAFAVHVVLACAAPDVMGTRVRGEISLGVLAMLFQGFLLVWTAAGYDRSVAGRPAPQEDREERG